MALPVNVNCRIADVVRAKHGGEGEGGGGRGGGAARGSCQTPTMPRSFEGGRLGQHPALVEHSQCPLHSRGQGAQLLRHKMSTGQLGMI